MEATSKNPKAVRLIFKTAAENPELARSSLRVAKRDSRSLAKRKAKEKYGRRKISLPNEK